MQSDRHSAVFEGVPSTDVEIRFRREAFREQHIMAREFDMVTRHWIGGRRKAASAAGPAAELGRVLVATRVTVVTERSDIDAAHCNLL
jgi:hypothetical protein